MKNKLQLLTLISFFFSSIISFLYIKNILSFDGDILKVIWLLFSIIYLFYSIQKKSLTSWIIFAMIVGVQVGLNFPDFAFQLQFLSKIFLRLIKTIIAPILFATLVVGIASHSNMKQLGRMGWKSILYFEVVTTLALVIGLIAINISQAGKGVVIPAGLHEDLPATAAMSWQDHIIHIFPENFIKSIYHGEVLPIVVFSIIFGIALAQLPIHKKEPLLNFTESLADVMFRFTNIIMKFAPLGVGGAIAYTTAHMGIDMLISLLKLLITLYITLVVFIVVILVPIALIARINIRQFIKAVSEPVSIAFATTSSESALPLAMENMEKIGVPRKIVAFVLPTGYTFNLDGTTLYLSLASIFVAQVAGKDLPFSEQLLIGLTLMLTSKGVAGIPRASLVILMGVVTSFDLPMLPVMAILGIDELMDMARTSVNVIGNCLASAVVARWEGELDDEKMNTAFTVAEPS
ncbi:dicarboxylate/amino acid:cation symporter [Taibaiella sp. KBW10]|uniref:dicarboxylate/amino acid:cation symporter n=1 Tax=Taibaiella sp. KBW10 TaxID=2153357 RepID=UPI000F59CAA9|nr:cation:dicarboxylase symporter family transporter [Taibaiella sp. KBW10]RQO31451.1 dicarboxylate/amino acid:cation symporter [Taibaiella sp. KBW10]